MYKEDNIPGARQSAANTWLLYQGAVGDDLESICPSAGAAIPQPDPTALSHLLLIPVCPDIVWDGKIPNSILLLSSAPFAAWDGHVLQF